MPPVAHAIPAVPVRPPHHAPAAVPVAPHAIPAVPVPAPAAPPARPLSHRQAYLLARGKKSRVAASIRPGLKLKEDAKALREKLKEDAKALAAKMPKRCVKSQFFAMMLMCPHFCCWAHAGCFSAPGAGRWRRSHSTSWKTGIGMCVQDFPFVKALSGEKFHVPMPLPGCFAAKSHGCNRPPMRHRCAPLRRRRILARLVHHGITNSFGHRPPSVYRGHGGQRRFAWPDTIRKPGKPPPVALCHLQQCYLAAT